MKAAALILGVVLAAAGTAILFDLVRFTDREEVVSIGGFEASIERQRSAPQGLGVGLLVAGGALFLYGLVRRR